MKKDYWVPENKFDLSQTLAQYFVSRDLQRYKELDNEDRNRLICKNHKMLYNPNDSIARLTDRLALKLRNERSKSQLHAIYFNVMDGKQNEQESLTNSLKKLPLELPQNQLELF